MNYLDREILIYVMRDWLNGQSSSDMADDGQVFHSDMTVGEGGNVRVHMTKGELMTHVKTLKLHLPDARD